MLLVLDEQSGFIELSDSWDFACVVAGSVIADLALAYRIDTDLEKLRVIDPNPTGDPILDETLSEMVAEEKVFNTQYWIEKNTRRTERVVEELLERLVENDILQYEIGGFWELSSSVASSRSYESAEGANLQEAKSRILNVVLNDEIPTPRDVLLISLLHSCQFMKLLLTEEDYEEKRERIELLAGADLIGQSIASSIQETTLLPRPRAKVGMAGIPKVKWRDLLREKGFHRGNIPLGLSGVHKKYGPVIQTPMKFGQSRAVLLTGLEVNRWVNKYGRLYLRTRDYINDFAAVFGAARVMPGMDGAEHYRLRKSTRAAYSRNALIQTLPECYQRIRKSLRTWNTGEAYKAAEKFSNHVSSQVSHLMVGVDCAAYIDELLAYKDRALTVHVQKALPKWTLGTPKMKRAKKNVSKLLHSIKSAHTPALREGKPQDIADAYMELHRQDPQFMPETDLTFPFAASLVASLYMGNALAFSFYNLIKHPEIYAKVAEEGEVIFGNGRDPAAEDFDGDKVDVTRRVFLESERLYPVIPVQLRTVMNRCVVSGFELEPKTLVMIGHTGTHYMEEFFENPLEFDIDRFLPGREEHLQPSVYVPYGLGTHHCLGHRYLELQAIVNLLFFAYHFELELVPSNYKMRINPFSNLSPSKKMKIRVAKLKHPIPTV